MTKTKKDYDSGKCLELALEGERLCKSYEFDKGITQFKAALECGTNDQRVLSAIFSQLGNAYFYKKDYQKALRYHDLDLQLSKSDNDLVGESKACGNLGNTYKMLEQFEQAIHYCTKHLEIARLLKDQVGESRALYNLGNVYHTKGKTMAINSNRNLIDFPAEIKECLLKAIDYYKQNLELMKIAGDRDAQGRACGNIGNTYYLLGEFEKAIEVHSERLLIAKECGDREAERRAHCNLGNAHIFCGEFEKSIENYKQSLFISQEIGNPVLEAQAYFSIGNAYFLLKDYKSAIEFYLKHLKFAQLLDDKLGQSRACWSLGNAYNELGDTEGALRFASYHLQLAKETNDKASEEIASKSVIDLKRKLEDSNRRNLSDISNAGNHSVTSNSQRGQIATEHNLRVKDGIDYFQRKQHISSSTSKLIEVVNESEFFNKNNLLKRNHQHLSQTAKVFNSRPISEGHLQRFGKGLERAAVLNHYQTPVKERKRFQSRQSMENMEIMKLTPSTTDSKKASQTNSDQIDSKPAAATTKLVTTYCAQQSVNNPHQNSQPATVNSSVSNSSGLFLGGKDLEETDYFLDLLASFQSKRMDDQRCSLDLVDNKENHLPDHKQAKARKTSLNRSVSTAYGAGHSSGGNAPSTMEPQRDVKRRSSNPSFATESSTSTLTSATAECRDELFDLIEGIQSRRMDEQRAPLPPLRRSHTTQETLPTKSSSILSSTSSTDSQPADRSRMLHRMSTGISAEPVRHDRQMSFSTDILPDEDFFEMLMKCQSSRLEDQRTTLPSFAEAANNNNNEEVLNQNLINRPGEQRPPTNSSGGQSGRNDEEFLNLLMRFQAGRIEEQRSNLPKEEEDLINLHSNLNSSGSSANTTATESRAAVASNKKDKNAQ